MGYEFAQNFGEFVHGAANPSTADAVPLKVNCPEGAREATLGCPLTREAWDALPPSHPSYPKKKKFNQTKKCT